MSGEGHTLFSALRKILFEDKDVSFAGYDVEHPILGSTKFYLRV
ncbi:MAG: RpoL/Rpb11 RNA polymerase subunit family protein, partial [Promethearchaeota archaeon]